MFATHCCDQCDFGTDTDHQIEAVMVVVVVVSDQCDVGADH